MRCTRQPNCRLAYDRCTNAKLDNRYRRRMDHVVRSVDARIIFGIGAVLDFSLIPPRNHGFFSFSIKLIYSLQRGFIPFPDAARLLHNPEKQISLTQIRYGMREVNGGELTVGCPARVVVFFLPS